MELMKAAIAHRGFAIVEVMSPCVTFNKRTTYAWFKDNVYDLAARDDYAPHDRRAAFEVLTREGAIPLGIIYREERPTFEERCNLAATPIAQLDLRSSSRDYAAIAAAYGA
jgi:2-oxoglutarate ferredoxin oxidoreductase subunit beta